MTGLLTFRRMMSGDVTALVALEARSHAFPWSQQALQQSFDAGHHCLVCSLPEENTPLAYAVVSSVLDEASLLNICVNINQQGQGIGKALLKYMIKSEEEQGARCMHLEVRYSNETARHLYESSGFVYQGKRIGYYPAEEGREDACLYSLSISSSS